MPDPRTSFTQNIPQSIERDIERARTVDAVFLFRVTGDSGGEWTVNMKDAPGVTEGDSGDADCTIEISTEDWQALTDRPGKIKVTGNALLATKLHAVIR